MDENIVRAAIYPGIGVARVGNSQSEYIIGPEVPHGAAPPTGGYKDSSGALKRQAARFRIYGYDAAGAVVKEMLPSDTAKITWTVHVANKKAAWYEYITALDIPEAVPVLRRNLNFSGENRKKLMIDPGPLSITGKNSSGPVFTGRFVEEPVYLGELRTDEDGNLIFLGGRGVSGTPFVGKTLTTFANNGGWYDDTSDGPVTATVEVNGAQIPVDPAWVVTAPPNYAPEIISVQTMYDVIYEASVTSWIPKPPKPSFTTHILPILQQLSGYQWVNKGFLVQFGWGSPYDFLDTVFVAKLARADDLYQELRQQIFNMFRAQSSTTLAMTQWPPVYGDAFGSVDTSPRAGMMITNTSYGFLQEWVQGNFVSDYAPRATPGATIRDFPIAQQPEILNHAAMRFCMGGPFHPGCEMTWPMRHGSLYSGPFRLRHRDPGFPERDYGDVLKPEVAVSDTGPVTESSAGDLTRWMSVPWQCDAASCRSAYGSFDPYLPTFWAARVPNHVLSADDYAIVMDAKQPFEKRLRAFNNRVFWLRWLTGAGLRQITDMVEVFGRLGVIEKKPGPGDKTFPSEMFVESTPEFEPLEIRGLAGASDMVVEPAPEFGTHPLRVPLTLDDWHDDRARRYKAMVKALG